MSKPKKSDWTAQEDVALKDAFAQQLEQLGREPKGREWDPIVAALPAREEGLPARSRKAAQGRALRGLKLREKVERKRRGPDWNGDDHRRGGKDASREKEAAVKRQRLAELAASASPSASPLLDPPRKRAAAIAAAENWQEAEAEAKRQALPLTAADLLPESARRLQIALYYLEELEAPPKEEWQGYKGTVYDIYTGIRGLSQNHHDGILRVLTELHECAEAGIEYTGERKQQAARRRAVLQIGSEDAKVVARAMEKNMGIRKAHFLLCLSRHQRGEPWVGVSAVYSLHLALKPVVTAIEKCKQGKTDPDAHWSQARDAFSTQVMIRRGLPVDGLPCLRVRHQAPPPKLIESPVADEDFFPATSIWDLNDPAFVFKLGPKGLGCYRDSGAYKVLRPYTAYCTLPAPQKMRPLVWVADSVTVELAAPEDCPEGYKSAVTPAQYMPGPEPLWYCKERLPAIRQDRVATGDEVHMEPTIAVGGVKRKGSQRQYRYHWDADGNPTPTATAETTLGPRKFIQQVKYTEQTRVMLATALTPEDHPRAKKYPGIALPTYDYTGKWLDSIPVFEERCEEQKRHIQKKGAVSRWVTGRREGELYPDDGVEHFSGIQTVVAQQLCGLGVSTVRIVAKLSDSAIKQLATVRHSGDGAVEGKLSPRTGRWSKGGRKPGKMIVAGLSEPFLTEMREQAQAACARAAAPGGQTSHPTQKDHRRERDPYASRYLAAGEAERQLVADVRTKGNVCVTELATALWGAAATFYRKCGETHPDKDPEKYSDWWVYHDALAQLCEKQGRD